MSAIRGTARGSTLLETLLAMALLTLGLVGLGPVPMLCARMRQAAAQRAGVQYLLASRLEQLRARAGNASSCSSALETGTESASVQGRDLIISWVVEPADPPGLSPPAALILLTVTATVQGNDPPLDSLSTYQACRPDAP